MSLVYVSHDELCLQTSQFADVVAYVTTFLTDQHPGRKGHVCPFVEDTLAVGTCCFAVVHATARHALCAVVREAILERSQRADGGVSVLVFEKPISHRMLNRLHRAEQLEAMERGCMLGMFGPALDVPSLHHVNFFPSRAPQNILVVREMIPHDGRFLEQTSRFWKKDRIRMCEAYLHKFEGKTGSAERQGVVIVRSALARERTKWF